MVQAKLVFFDFRDKGLKLAYYFFAKRAILVRFISHQLFLFENLSFKINKIATIVV
jgi:hypothetical protein